MEENQNNIISKDKLLEAGIYFGHKKRDWNPKMKPYISKINKGIHIIDIQKTQLALGFAYKMIKNYAEKGASFIFLGTKEKAKDIIKENALRANSYYVSERWLGGTFTNSRTIFKRVRRMEQLEKLDADNYKGYTKKEGLGFKRELEKLHRNLQGIRNMIRKPHIMIVADPMHDAIAVKEAKKNGVRIIGIADTNCDPSTLDIAIPANDDSLKSIRLIITILADAIVSTKDGTELFAFQKDEKIEFPAEEKKQQAFRNNYRRREFTPWNRQKRDYSYKNKDYTYKRDENTKNESKYGVTAEKNVKNELKYGIAAEKSKRLEDELQKAKIKEDRLNQNIKKSQNDNFKYVVTTEKNEKLDQNISKDQKKLESLSLMELKNLAKQKLIKNYSKMKKTELIDILNK